MAYFLALNPPESQPVSLRALLGNALRRIEEAPVEAIPPQASALPEPQPAVVPPAGPVQPMMEKEAEGKLTTATGDGFTLEDEDLAYLLSVAGLVQAREDGSSAPFRLRIGVAGTKGDAELLARAAKEGQVLITEDARSAARRSPLGAYFQFEELDPGEAQGLAVGALRVCEYLYDSRLSRLDGPFRTMFAAEIEQWVAPRRAARDRPGVPSPGQPNVANGLVGIALSGGGQRSAVFSLGVCQALARHGLLAEADYLSTVSGGGYFGASLQSLCAEPVPYVDVREATGGNQFGAESRNFPYAFPRDPEPAPPPELPIHGLESPALWHVRKHAKLLGTRIGLLDAETWGMLYRFLGGMLISWVIFLVPLPFLGVAACTWLFDEWLEDLIRDPATGAVRWAWVLGPPLGTIALEAILYVALGPRLRAWVNGSPSKGLGWLHAFARRAGRGIALVLALLPLGWLLYLGLAGAVFLIVDASRGGTEFKSLLGAVGGLSAIATTLGVTGVTRSGSEDKGSLVVRILLGVGGPLLLAVLVTLLAWGTWVLFQSGPHYEQDLWYFDGQIHFPIPFILMNAAALLLLYGSLALRNRDAARLLNWLSIHDVYQDRICKTWTIAANPAEPAGVPGVVHRWSQVWSRPSLSVRSLATPGPTTPYPLVCATINIPGSRGDKLAERKGDSFVFAPIYSGSASTRWVPTASEAWEYRAMPLAQAATISGAAFSPNMGEKSTRTFSILMTIFNARIGRWCDNPRTSHRKNRSALKLYFKELFGNPSRDDHQVYLSDGGHFENLGLYELIRRRCKFILAVTADIEKAGSPDMHGNLATATRMVREDFGVQIEMPNVAPITRDDKGGVLSSFAVGTISYPKARQADGTPSWDRGILVVIKAGIIPAKVSIDLLNHWRVNPDFPYTSTLDQQFDQGQFEAYRQLGYMAGNAVGHASGARELTVAQRFGQAAQGFQTAYRIP